MTIANDLQVNECYQGSLSLRAGSQEDPGVSSLDHIQLMAKDPQPAILILPQGGQKDGGNIWERNVSMNSSPFPNATRRDS